MSTSDEKDPVEQAAEKAKEAAENIDPPRIARYTRIGGGALTMAVGFALIGSGVHSLWTNYKGKGTS